ncbi:hypothetical protein MD537_01345 [Flavihumibacter sediminis]|nr:hypothetical protein [Flavihumibacter sediminis]
MSFLKNKGSNGMLIKPAVAINIGSIAQGMGTKKASFLSGLFSLWNNESMIMLYRRNSITNDTKV